MPSLPQWPSLLLAGSLLLTPALNAQKPPTPPAPCDPNQLSLGTDEEDGQFNGMSKSGVLVVVRNLGPDACRIAPIANMTFTDTAGKDLLPADRLRGRIGMHPGPVVLPIIVPAKAEITADLIWVSGDVYDHGVCITPTALQVQFGSITLSTALKATVCWNRPDSINFDGIRFAPDPVYSPKSGPKP